MKKYTVRRTDVAPALGGDWDGPVWGKAETADLTHFLPKSSDHRPRAQARVLYDDAGIYGMFRVEDRYVRCVNTQFQDQVCRDSCVEFFFNPKPGAGYFNFEFNCGGTFLCYYITDPSRRHRGPIRQHVKLTEADAELVRIYHSMPSVVDPEITEPTTWFLEFFIPYALLEKYTGTLDVRSGAAWEGNFYKCGDATSHPAWACWSPVNEHNFHLPHCFGKLVFE
jgi:hypothetical protein